MFLIVSNWAELVCVYFLVSVTVGFSFPRNLDPLQAVLWRTRTHAADPVSILGQISLKQNVMLKKLACNFHSARVALLKFKILFETSFHSRRNKM